METTVRIARGSQDHEPFAAKAERFRRLLADLIARQIMNQRRGQSGGGKS